MAKIKMPISPETLQRAVDTAEASGPFAARSHLYVAVADLLRGEYPKITPSVVLLRINEFGTVMKTTKGRLHNVGGGPKTARKMDIKALSRVVPPRWAKSVQRLAKGSLKAAIKLKCLDCCCWDVKEIKGCEIKDCSLWNFRPYK